MKEKYLFSTIISQLHGHVSSHLGKQTKTRQNSQDFLTIRHTINPSKRIVINTAKGAWHAQYHSKLFQNKSVEQKPEPTFLKTKHTLLNYYDSSLINIKSHILSSTQAVSPAILSVMYSFCTNIYITCNSNCMLWNTTTGSI